MSEYAAFTPEQPQPPRKPKRSRKWIYGIGALFVLGGIAVAANGGEATDAAKEGFEDGLYGADTTQVDERPTPVAEPATLPDNGTLRVGVDIQPGGYVVSLGDDALMGDTGYWERLSCLTGDFSCILSNELVQGPGYLTVLPTDVAVKVQNVQLQPEG